MVENIIELKNLCKSYDESTVLDNFSLNIKKNEFLTLLGPSGCGKTTTLKIIAGFEYADDGKVIFEGKDINNIPPYQRPINTVFQKYALFPHMNIYENIAFGLRIKKLPKDEIDRKVKEMLKLVALEGYENRKIDSLSGGQQQRIAIARALVNEPKVLLLDEPLGALDLKLRQEMQIELKRMQQKLGITFIFVTHDQEEALSMSDTIIVMNKDKGFEKNENIEVVIRPEDIKMVQPNEGMIKGIVTSTVFKGVHYEILVKENDRMWMLHNTKSAEVGSELGMDIYPEDIHIMRKVEN